MSFDALFSTARDLLGDAVVGQPCGVKGADTHSHAYVDRNKGDQSRRHLKGSI